MSSIERIAHHDARMIKVVGAVRTGKTETLLERCAALVSAGADPSRIFVETATPFAADAFRVRLRAKIGRGAADVTVCTATQMAAFLLGNPAAIRDTGRIPRLVTDAERKFLLEDLKTTGLKVRAMRGMLDRFRDKWCALESESTWLVDSEEAGVYAFLLERLEAYGAMLPEEAARLAVDFLRSDRDRARELRFDYVLCDDFQNMTCAEQTMCCLLANKQMMVAGNQNQTTRIDSLPPHPRGFENFDALRYDVDVFTLDTAFANPAVQRFAEAAFGEEGLDASIRSVHTDDAPAGRAGAPVNPGEGMLKGGQGGSSQNGGVRVVSWNNPDEELNEMTKYLRFLANRDPENFSKNTLVVVPNALWARSVGRLLRTRGFSVTTAGTGVSFGGDPRERDRCKALTAYLKLNLLANPADPMAWRCWTGIGNYLANSDAWGSFFAFMNEHGLGLVEALNLASSQDGEVSLRSSALTDAYREGVAFIEANNGRKGFALMRAIGAEGLREFTDVFDALAGDESAGELFAIVRTMALFPHFIGPSDKLRIMYAPYLCGLEAENVFVLGAIDGFYPPREAFEVVSTEGERRSRTERNRRSFFSATSKATGYLTLSTFSKAPLELAEQAKMQVSRVRSEGGERIALVRPSMFLDEASTAYPGFTGGQQLMMEHNLA